MTKGNTEAAPIGDSEDEPQRVAVPSGEREALLDTIWGLQAAAIAEALKHGEPSAALLNVVTKWLGEQGVNWDSIKSRRGGSMLPPGTVLPFFGDEPSEPAEAATGDQ